MKTTHAVRVGASADDAFAYLADVRNETQWRRSIVGSRYVGTLTPAIGVPGETDVEMGPRALTMRWTIVEFDESARFVRWELDGDPWHGGGSYRVDEDAAGARVTGSLVVRVRGAARILEPVLGMQFRRGLRADLARLTSVLAPAASAGR